MLKLSKYNCEKIEFITVVSLNRKAWQEFQTFFEKGRRKTKGQARDTVRAILEYRKSSDHHIHFGSHWFRDGKKELLGVSFGFYRTKGKDSQHVGAPRIVKIGQFESWLLEFLSGKLKDKRVVCRCQARLIFPTRRFKPIIEIPFKNPFPLGDNDNVLGSISISGLRFDLLNSAAGLSKLYLEALPDSMVLTEVFKTMVVFQENLVEEFLDGARRISNLFVRKVKV